MTIQTLTVPRGLGILGVVAFVFFGGMAGFSVAGHTRAPLMATALFAAFALAGGWMALAVLVERYVLSASGLSFRPLVGRIREVEWDDVRDLSHNQWMNWFSVRGRTQEIRVSSTFQPLSGFARAVLTHVDHAAIKPETLAILRELADT